MSPALVEQRARERLLLDADLQVEGLLTEASNVTVRAWLGGGDEGQDAAGDGVSTGGEPVRHRAVYKPVTGSTPLRDFDSRTLPAREVAAYLVSRAGGWHLVPPTVLRDGPLGLGSAQWWIEGVWGDAGNGPLLDVVAPPDLSPGWLPVVQVEDERGAPYVVAHADRPDLASMAVLDAVLNNADRKGSHLALDPTGRLWGFDHGLTLHTQDKLRTVLWGWAGDPLPPRDLARLATLDTLLRAPSALRDRLDTLVGEGDRDALHERVCRLTSTGRHPLPPRTRQPLPWPIW